MATERDGSRAGAIDPGTIFEVSPDAILITDSETGVVVDANEAAVDLFGQSRDSLCKRALGDLCQNSAETTAVLEEAIEAGSAQREWEIDQNDGTRQVDVTIKRANDDRQVLAFFEDFTNRRELELERQSSAMETAMDGMAIVDESGEYLYANKSHAEMYGYDDASAFIGKSWEICYGKEQLERFEADIRPTLNADGKWRGEAIGRRKDGTTFPQELSLTARDDGGLVCVVRDITERREREQRLEENDAILTQLTETTDDVFWLFDSDFDELLFINDAYEEIWGRSVEALEEDAMDFMQGVHPDDRDIVAGAVERLRNGESTEHEYRVNPDENYGRWVWVRGEPIMDTDGTVKRVAGFARDITERKQRERELERSERQFEAVFNDPQLLVGLLNTDGTIRHVNDTAIDHAAADREEIEGVPFPETPWWNYDEELQADLREWIDRAADGEYVEFEADHPLPDGTKMTVSGTIRPVTDDEGTVRSLITSARDITGRKERERQLEESNERLEKFAYVASHDLQEPLRTISNYIELIEEEYGEDLDEDAEEFIDVVVTGSNRMQSMINGLLDYSRVTTRGEEFEPVDTEAVATNVSDDLAVMLEEHDGTVTWDDLPTVDADSAQFHQVVQNLVKNALEHSGDEPVEIEIRATEAADEYRFEVADDGPGIEPNRQEKIFRIFKSGKQYQTSSQAKGIGLAICDNIVQRHGGDIWVESEPGDGATFVFTIEKDQ